MPRLGSRVRIPSPAPKFSLVRLKLQKITASRGGRAHRGRRFVLVDFTHMNAAERLRVYEAGNMCAVRRVVAHAEGLSDEKTAGRYLL